MSSETDRPRPRPDSAPAAGPAGESDSAAAGTGTSAGIVLLLTSGATFIALLDATVVNVAFPDLRQSFPSISVAQLTLVITAYAILFAAVLAAAGRIADITGRRRLFVLSVAGFVVTSVLASSAPSAPWLIVARALQGATAAGMIPSALGLLLIHTPPARRAAAIGAWSAVGGLAAAVGPALGGVMVEIWDWRGVFLINVPIGLLVIAGALRRIEPEPPSSRTPPDAVGIVALVLAIGGPVVALSQGNDWGWTDPWVLVLFGFGLVFGTLVAVRSRTQAAPAIDFGLWNSRTFATANVVSALFGAALYAWLLACPVFLAVIWDYSVLKSGLGITPGAFTAIVGAVLVGRTPIDRQWRLVLGAGIVAGVAFAAMGLTLSTDPTYLALWLPPGLIGGACIGTVLTGVSSLAAHALPEEQFAAGTGMLMTSRQVGGAIGVAGLAAILQADGPLAAEAFYRGFIWCGVVSMLAGLAAVAFRRSTRVA